MRIVGHARLLVGCRRAAPAAARKFELLLEARKLRGGEEGERVDRREIAHVEHPRGFVDGQLLDGAGAAPRVDLRRHHVPLDGGGRARVREERKLADRLQRVQRVQLKEVVERTLSDREDESVRAGEGAASRPARELEPSFVVPAGHFW